jgi:hypothetical protein
MGSTSSCLRSLICVVIPPPGRIARRVVKANNRRERRGSAPAAQPEFLLIGPLGDDPLVITGSANVSSASTTSNDENMLVVRGDRDVADAHFGEFMRLFDHIYARHIITRMLSKTAKKNQRNYLANDNSWMASHRQGPKGRRRQRFHGPWA